MLNISGEIVDSEPADYGAPVLRLGFRPFFLAAGVFAIVSMLVWLAAYTFSASLSFNGLSGTTWHAHEMIFGYTLAVIAGFLLTAVKNWTGIEVLRGRLLGLLLTLWLVPRVLLLSGLVIPLGYIAVVDCTFLLMLIIVCLRPVLIVRQYKQVGIISKLLLLLLCNVCFYLGIAGVIEDGVRWGLYSAIYIIISLMLLMMRRVMPMFINNAIEKQIDMKNRAWVDISSLVLLVGLWISDVFTSYYNLTAVLAVVLTLLHLLRLSGWYTAQIWSKPLLWVLVVAYVSLILGFGLKALSIFAGISPFLSIHAYTVGGIGMLTVGMMSRVALGHTGRNVFEPPGILFWIFAILLFAAVFRVLFPLFDMDLYVYWIGMSQVLWIVAFAVFVYVYAPMLLTARVDGRDG